MAGDESAGAKRRARDTGRGAKRRQRFCADQPLDGFWSSFCRHRGAGAPGGPGVGGLALISVVAIMIILLAVLALVVVQALASSPWGVFTIAMTIPVALIMGFGLRTGRGNVGLVTAFGLLGLVLSGWGGQFLAHFPALEAWFRHDQKWLAWAIILYGLAASILPVWLLLTPRDYLSTFLKLGTVAALALAGIVLHPPLLRPSCSRFFDGPGL